MKTKVGVGVLDMLVDDPHIMIFWIILVIHMTREALGLHSLSFKVQSILIATLNGKIPLVGKNGGITHVMEQANGCLD
jgi:hypothetical protein